MSEQEVIFCRHTAAEARQLRDTVEAIYVRSYVEAIASGDPFHSIEAFMHRFDSYAAAPAFDLVAARQGSDAIGQAWGWPLTERSGWWKGLRSEPEPGFTQENGRRTFALSESWCLRSGPGKASRTRYTITSWRAAQKHGQPFSWNQKIPEPTVHTYGGAGAKLHNYTPAGRMHQHSMCSS